jgi:hypothetical protein
VGTVLSIYIAPHQPGPILDCFYIGLTEDLFSALLGAATLAKTAHSGNSVLHHMEMHQIIRTATVIDVIMGHGTPKGIPLPQACRQLQAFYCLKSGFYIVYDGIYKMV